MAAKVEGKLFQFTSPILAAVALPIVLWIVWTTRRPVRPIARWCSRIAAILFCVALAGFQVRCDRPPTIVVMVDVSPSTRGALLRDPKAVAARVAPLLAGRAVTVRYFADGLLTNDVEPQIARTRLEVSPADAIVLFSDGRLEAPSSLPPVFAVVDPSLDSPGDGRVVAVDAGEGASVSVAIDGKPRRLNVSGAGPGMTFDLTGDRVVSLRMNADAITAALDGGDRWPENDVMSAVATPKNEGSWAVDGGVPGMRAVAAAALPTSAGGYLAAAVVVVPTSSAVSDAAAAALRDYVQSLGGTLLLTGPPAFAPAALRDIAPLSATPPQPRGQWVILLDASGSMGEAGKWPAALAAAERALASVGADESVSLIMFNRSPRGIIDHQSPAAVVQALHGLNDFAPTGPTGLRPALESIAGEKTGPTRVLLVTDGDVDLGDVNALAKQMSAASIQLFALISTPSDPITRLATATGGTASIESSPANWPRTLAGMAGAARSTPAAVTGGIHGTGALSGQTIRATQRWPSWQRSGAAILGTTADAPVVAEWQAGLGRIVSIAADIRADDLANIAGRSRSSVNDPRFTVDIDETVGRVTADAIDNGRPMNGLALLLKRGDLARAFSRVAPGRYEAAIESGPEPSVAVISLDGRVVARRPIGGRYLPEFNIIGNDRDALKALAARTGGRFIDVGDNRPIEIPLASQWRSLQLPAAVGGVLLSLAALLLLRMPYLEARMITAIWSFWLKYLSRGAA